MSLDRLQALVDASASGLRLQAPIWTTLFRIHHRHARRYRSGRVFLAGDAAHVHSPAGALGMNTGIQDACNLGWKLALVLRGAADPSLLDTYEEERWPIGRSAVRASDRPFTIATSQRWLFRQVCGRLAPRLLPRFTSVRLLRRLVYRAASQLDLSYRRRTLLPGRRPTEGDRLPDARITIGGREVWLHELLAPAGFTLLLCGPPDAWDPAAVRDLEHRYAPFVVARRLALGAGGDGPADAHGSAFVRLQVRGATQLLVRPDGHVAARREGSDLGAIDTLARRWLSGQP